MRDFDTHYQLQYVMKQQNCYEIKSLYIVTRCTLHKCSFLNIVRCYATISMFLNLFFKSVFLINSILFRATPETNRELSTSEMYMIDSGGQYLGGTTDVTRTVHHGEPTDFEKVRLNSSISKKYSSNHHCVLCNPLYCSA